MNKKVVTIKNNEQIAYYDINPKAPNVLVCIHGNFSSATYFEPLFENISGKIRVIAPDTRGYGDSSYHKRFDSLRELSGDVKQLLDHLQIKKFSVLGWSLGGGIALELAADYPDLVDKLILVSSTPFNGYPLYKKDTQLQQINGVPYRSKDELALDPISVAPLYQALTTGNLGYITSLFDQIIYTGTNKPSVIQVERWGKESLKQRCLIDADWAIVNLNMSDKATPYAKATNRIKLIKARVLHLWGDRDLIVSKEMFDLNRNALAASSTHIIYGGGGHDIFVDFPRIVTNDISRFVLS